MSACVVFLDVDGTYVAAGRVPDAHVEAVRAARARGTTVLLATGRPVSMLPERILAAGFDGVVASAGAYVELHGEVLADRRFDPDVAARTVDVLDDAGAWYLLEATDALYGHPGLVERFTAHLGRHLAGSRDEARAAAEETLAHLRTRDDLHGASFAKVTVVDSPVELSELVARIGPGIDALPPSIPGVGGSGGEMFMAGMDKSVGIDVVCGRLGLTRADAVAFGDGANDLGMIAAAGVGVAMAGAEPAVLALADLVVPGPQDGGVAVGLRLLGLV